MKSFISNFLFVVVGFIVGINMTKKILSKPIKKYQNELEKFQLLFLMMNQWVKLKQDSGSLEKWLIENKYNSVAIYGMGSVGVTLYNELRNSKVSIVYAIDKNKSGVTTEVNVYSPDEELPNVDLIVVSAISYFDEIEKKLKTKMKCPIISLEDIIFNI